MRAIFLTCQLCLLGLVYLFVAVPLFVVVFGLAYALVVATEMVFAAFAMGIAEVVLASLPPLLPSMTGSVGGGSIILAAGSGATQAATVLFCLALPWLLALAFNLVCVFLARYRGWFGKMRRWAIIANIVALGCYLLPQLLVIGLMLYDVVSPSEESVPLTLGDVAVATLAALAWDIYFFISIAMLLRMRERPDPSPVIKAAAPAHTILCVALVAGFAGLLTAMGSSLGGFAIIFASVILCLAAFILLGNARAARRIADGRKKLLFLYAFLRTLLVALFCLVFFPPVGVILALSAAFLYFLMEAVFLDGREQAPGLAPATGPTPSRRFE